SVLTLTLTIGAATAVFSIVEGVLLKPLAYRESHRLVALRETWRQLPSIPALEVNEQHFEYWRAHARSFESMAQYIALPGNLTGAGDAAQITVVHTSGSIFDALQAPAAIGRTLTPDDERSDRPDVVVITDTLWRQRFGADRSAVGRSIAVDGRVRTIVGVMPAELEIPDRSRLTANVDAFVPLRMDDERVGWVGDHNNDALGRLNAGVTPEQARIELDLLQRQVSDEAAKQ